MASRFEPSSSEKGSPEAGRQALLGVGRWVGLALVSRQRRRRLTGSSSLSGHNWFLVAPDICLFTSHRNLLSFRGRGVAVGFSSVNCGIARGMQSPPRHRCFCRRCHRHLSPRFFATPLQAWVTFSCVSFRQGPESARSNELDLTNEDACRWVEGARCDRMSGFLCSQGGRLSRMQGCCTEGLRGSCRHSGCDLTSLAPQNSGQRPAARLCCVARRSGSCRKCNRVAGGAGSELRILSSFCLKIG